MAASTQFVLAGDPAAARALVEQTIGAQGFTFEQMPSGALRISRGNGTKTLLLGAMAGKDFLLQYYIGYGSDEQGRLLVRLDRDLGGSAIKGGVIGANKAANGFQDLNDSIGRAATEAGMFVSTQVLA